MIERKKRPKAKKKSSKIWSIREKCVLLHRLSGRKVLMVTVVQLVRASDCGSECRGFESHRSPFFKSLTTLCCEGFFCLSTSSPSLCFPSARPTTVRQGSGRCPLPACPFPRVSPLLSPLCVSNGLCLIGKCRPPTCPLAHVPQCPWLPITLCPASSSYAKRGKSSAWVGK